MGDRLTQNGVNYTLDLNAGLTQVLDDGVNSYTYGIGRISQQQGTTVEYFLGDALGSVRQLSNANGDITLAKSYDPYGSVIQSSGTSQTSYGFASEYTDANGLIHLRARYYAPEQGRFLTRDTWNGNHNSPQSLHKWNYAQSNPVNYTDPSGNYCIAGIDVGPWGDKCTEEEKMRAAQYIASLGRIYNSSQNFKLGFVYELMDSLLVAGPETQKAVWELLRNTQVGKKIESTTAVGTLLASLFCNIDALKNSPLGQVAQAIESAIINIKSDPYFVKGRVAGRITAVLMAGGMITAGIFGNVSSKPGELLLALAGAPSGGATLTLIPVIEAVSVGAVAWGGAIALSAALKEWNDKLVRSAIAGGGGGGGMFGSSGTQFTSKTFWTSREGKVRLDGENPNPGKRPGNIHIQDKTTVKTYYYNPSTGWFDNLPSDIERLISNDQSFNRAFQTALKYLGE